MEQPNTEGVVAGLRPNAPRTPPSGDRPAGDSGPSPEQISIAYHEAGHAVIARVLAVLSGGIWLDGNGEELGGVTVADPWLILDTWMERKKYRGESSALRARIIAYMAGREAELAFVGTQLRRNDGDHDEIATMLEALSVPITGESSSADRERYGERLRKRTRAMVRRHSREIHRLAAEVQKRGSLRLHEIDLILSRI